MRVGIPKFWRGFCCTLSMAKINFWTTLLCASLLALSSYSQEMRIKKGIIVDSLKVHDSIPDSYALFLPQRFEMKGKWPLLAVFNMKGDVKRQMFKYTTLAEKYGYVVVGYNSVRDTVSLSENMIRTKRVLDHLISIFPINKSRIYTAGKGAGGRFANLVPIFLKDIEGTVVENAALANVELLNAKNPFQFVGIVAKENYNYFTLLKDEKVFNSLKFPNSLLVSNTDETDTAPKLEKALRYFNLSAMAKGNMPKDSLFISSAFKADLNDITSALNANQFLVANRAMAETINAFRNLTAVDSLREMKKQLKRKKEFRNQKRGEEAAFFKETFLREDFAYYLEEDVLTYNFNNLGWWTFQMDKIDGYSKGVNLSEKLMGYRLRGYVNALIEDNIDLVTNLKVVDEEALVFLYMLKTITDPKVNTNYFKVASLAAKNEDYGTALFYLEEVLKKGLATKEEIYSIPNTALLRITPEFNTLVDKYFKDARYKIKDE